MAGGTADSGLSVVEDFARLRARILKILDSVEAAARSAGQRADEVSPSIARARERIAAENLLLSIVGAEGHGKSTLLNALMGKPFDALLPTDPDLPATVAPIELAWGDHPQPRYAITRQGEGDAEHECRGPEEFRDYLLQRHNHRNRKRVARGLIRLRHDYLRRGLTIVDTPGVFGVDEDIRAQVAADLYHYTNAIVAVTRDRRGHGALASVFEEYAVKPHRAVIVVNVDIEFVDRRLAPLEGLGDTVAKVLETKRQGAVATLARTGIEIDPARVFVVCLPVMAEQVDLTSFSIDPAHKDEVRRLREAIWTQVEEQSFGTVLHDAADMALEALQDTETYLKTLDTIIGMVVSGDAQEQDRRQDLQATIDRNLMQARTVMRDGLFSLDRLERQIEEDWRTTLAPVVERAREETARFLGQKLALVDSMAEVSTVDGQAIRQDIEAFARDISVPINRTRNAAIWSYVETLCEQSNRVLLAVYHSAPELQALARAGHRVEVQPETLPQLSISRTQPDLFVYLLNSPYEVGATVGGGILAVALAASAGFAPFAAVPVLFVLGGSAGWYAITRTMGGRKRALKRFLNERLSGLDDMTGAPAGPLFQQWRFVCLKMAGIIETTLERELDTVARLFHPGSGSLTDLRHARAELQETLKVIDAYRADLNRMIATAVRAG